MLDLNKNALERLGSGDAIFAVEQLKRAALDTAELLTPTETGSAGAADRATRIGALLDRSDEPSERYLAALFHIVEYGSAHSLEAIPRTLAHIARETALLRIEQDVSRQAGVVVVGRVVWALVAYALHCRRVAAITATHRAAGGAPFTRGETLRIVSATPLRYPDALEGNAGNSFAHYRDWIAARELLRERCLLFTADLQGAINEADLVLALLATAARGRGVYCEPLDRETVERLRVRLVDLEQRRQLAELFSIAASELDQTLERLYAALETNPRRIDQPPDRLLEGD